MLAALKARVDQIENWVWQALARAGSGDTLATELQYTFVFRPGATPPLAPNVYATWPTLMAAVGRVQGPKIVELDASIAPCVVSAGAWNVNDVTFVSAQPGIGTTLTIPTGATFTIPVASGGFQADFGAELTSTSTAPVLVIGNDVNIAMTNFGVLQSSPGAAAFLHVLAGGTLDMQLLESTVLGNGTTAAVLLDAGATFTVDTALGSSTISAHAVDGAGVSWTAFVDSSSPVRTPLGTATSVVHFVDNATQELYNPGVPGNWVAPPPTTVQQALDRIAANVGNAHPIP